MKLAPEAWLEEHWTQLDELLSIAEGWGIFEEGYGVVHTWQIRRRFIDVDGAPYAHERDAWRTVMDGETLTHDKARNFVRDYSPDEWMLMLNFTRPKRLSGNRLR